MISGTNSPNGEKNDSTRPIVIIGAGYSGICTAIDLIRRNKTRNFIIIEKSTQVGGTWNDNQYPGCCCDVWSHLYSLSFEPNPAWTREYPGQPEIHAYLMNTVQKWGLYQHIHFGEEVDEAIWNEATNTWNVLVRRTGGKVAEYGVSYSIQAQYLVSAIGQLNVPHYPKIEGLESFEGKIMHSARWDSDFSLAGKKVAIIGNGATAIQIIPEISKIVKNIVILQRTPNWLIPRNDSDISPTMQAFYRYVPGLRKRYRAKLMDMRESFFDAAATEDSELNTQMRQICLDMMKKQIPANPKLWAKLTPNYPPGCKRILISDNYYPALIQPQVELETRQVQKITAQGVQVDGKLHEVDVLILATGFRATEFMSPIKIYGEGGRSIKDIWKRRPQAYLGMTVSQLPNFAMLYGPNTNLGHNSIILMIEAQSRYINEMIATVLLARQRGESLSVVPTEETMRDFNKEVQSRLQKSTFASENCQSWYKNSEGMVINNWCGNVIEYQNRTSEIVWAEYKLGGSEAERIRAVERVKIGRVQEETQIGTWMLGALLTISSMLIGTLFAGESIVRILT